MNTNQKFVVSATIDGIKYYFARTGATESKDSAKIYCDKLDAIDAAKAQNTFEDSVGGYEKNRWQAEEIA